jgi:hypothetical protein
LKLRGAVRALAVSHIAMVLSSEVAVQVLHFLWHGRFSRASQ